MDEQKGPLVEIAEAIVHCLRRREPQVGGTPPVRSSPRWLRWVGRQMVPNIGTLLLVVVLLLTVPSLAAPRYAPTSASTSTMPCQGRLSDSGGNPLNGRHNLEFRIYAAPTGGTPLWTEMWTGGNAVNVSDGLFNVMLGSINNTLASAIVGQDELYLGITVDTDNEMAPRMQLGSVPFSMQAMTVPDESITTAKIATGAITTTHLLDGAVTANKLALGVLSETTYTLTLANPVWSTSSANATFGTINLPDESDLYVMSMWVLVNSSSDTGLRARLTVDGTGYTIYSDDIPLSAGGIGYTIARNHYIPNLAAGNHTFGVTIDQPTYRSGDQIGICAGSVMWIRAVPVRQ